MNSRSGQPLVIATSPSSSIKHDSTLMLISLLKLFPISTNDSFIKPMHCFRLIDSTFLQFEQSFLISAYKKNKCINKKKRMRERIKKKEEVNYFIERSFKFLQLSSRRALRNSWLFLAKLSTTTSFTSFWKSNKSMCCQLLPSNANVFQYFLLRRIRIWIKFLQKEERKKERKMKEIFSTLDTWAHRHKLIMSK